MSKILPITAEVRNIARPLTEAVVCPANGVGVMSKGAAKAILDVAGLEIQEAARDAYRANKKPFEPGTCFATKPYKMSKRGVKRIYHAVTIKYPGDLYTLDSVNKAIRSVLKKAVDDGIKTIAIPGIGTGSGRLDSTVVAGILLSIARNYSNLIEIRFIDTNKEFINELDRLLAERK